MYDTATRVALVKKRVRQKRCRQEKRVLCGLSAFCVVLSLSLMGAMGTIAGYGHSAAVLYLIFSMSRIWQMEAQTIPMSK